jgi:hypothetical protein
MRAVSFNLNSAKLMGINTDFVIAFTFALGSALAAAGGVLTAQYNPKIEPLMGIIVGLKAFVAAVLGGIGNIPGAVLGGLLIGAAETLVVGYATKDFKGVTGSITLDANRNAVKPAVVLELNPAENKFTFKETIYPEGMSAPTTANTNSSMNMNSMSGGNMNSNSMTNGNMNSNMSTGSNMSMNSNSANSNAMNANMR